jgi:hypothetical protein
MFGEEDVIELIDRTYSVKCDSQTAECIFISKSDFLGRVMTDEGSKIYLKRRVHN